jgi:hypothetical protein
LPQVRFVWKSDAASREVYASILWGTYEILPVDRFDGSLGFLVYLLEETLGKRVFLILRNPTHGILALHLEDRHQRQPAEVVLAREPLRRPREYRSGDSLRLCRVSPRRERTFIQRAPDFFRGAQLHERWRRGPFESLDLDGSSWLCRSVRGIAERLRREFGLHVVAAYRNRGERLIALLSADRANEWDKVAFVEELRLREQIPFCFHLVTVGAGGISGAAFPPPQ